MPISEFSGFTTVAFGFGGPTDIGIVAVLVFVLFGGSKIGPLFKSFGEGLREFKKATKEDEPNPAVAASVKGDGETKPVAVSVVSAKDEEKLQS